MNQGKSNRGLLRLGTMLLWLGLPLSGWAQVTESSASENQTSPGLYMKGQERLIPLPVLSTKVRGELRGFVTQVRVTQVYVNPYNSVIEATYVFPLPERAAVTGMIMHLANRDVVAEIHPREEAEKIYQEAVAQGHTASLMNQERPNIFTQKVGNIPPGEKVEVELTYIEALAYEDGVALFVFPTIVGPRYIPGQPLDGPSQEPQSRLPDTDRVPDASRVTPPVLAEGQTSAHRLDLELSVDPGLPIAELTSPSHQILIDYSGSDRAVVRLAPMDRLPNKDFILRLDLRGKQPSVTVLTHRQSGQDGYLTLALQPPTLPADKRDLVVPKDLYFVLDTSGSMNGQPLDACKDLVRQALSHLNPEDRFNIMGFSNDVSVFSTQPLTNTPENVSTGMKFIDNLQGGGGTEMLYGIRKALEGQPERGRIRIVFFLTDGYIGNDDEILKAVQEDNQAQARFFSFGVGSSVNRYLLGSMGRLGRGEVQYLRPDEDPRPVVERFYRRVSNPVLTNVSLDWGQLDVQDQSPQVVGDLFDNQPLLVHARYRVAGSGQVKIRGFLGNRPFGQEVSVSLPEEQLRPEIAALWARSRIAEWGDEETRWPGKHREQITAIALKHSLMSQYTSFVAVERAVVSRKASEPLIPVAQQLPLPEGVSRLALADISRQFIPPGDPIITVAAPADARRVTAYFPFGLVKDLTYDPERARWRGRFLVPAGIPDGVYQVRVAIELHNGRVVYQSVRYTLDSRVEEFLVLLGSNRVAPSKALEIHVDTVEPAVEVYVHCPGLGWEREKLSPEDGRRKVDWVGWLNVPANTIPKEVEVLVVVRDRAGNRLEKTVRLTVVGE